MTKNQTARLVLITAAAVFASILPASAQSLGDVARQEAARRKDVKAPAKVFTNDNLKGTQPVVPPAPPADPGAQPAAAPAEAADAKPPEAPDPTKDPEYWRKRMRDAVEARDRNAFLLEAVQSRINALTTDFYARDDPYQRAKIELDRNKSLAELERMKQQQLELEKAIGDLEEEARRANIPPGWLR